MNRIGWSSFFHNQLETLGYDLKDIARVTSVRRGCFLVSQGMEEILVTASGALAHRQGPYPVAGDWVVLNNSVLSAVLPRRNTLARGAAGARGKLNGAARREQVMAANLDTVLIVCGLDQDFNPARMERYLTLVHNCGLRPAIVLTKADIHPSPADCKAEAETVAIGVPIHLVSALDPSGPVELEPYIAPGNTIALIGSSGAGKSTLVNRLAGQAVRSAGEVSQSDGKGRHTTTSRDMFFMPQGGMVIDNPGIREIAFWDDQGGVDAAFPDIERLARDCRFSDCSHAHEPGCRVLSAVEGGELHPERLASWKKMRQELEYAAQRQTKTSGRIEKERWKEVATLVKTIKKGRKHGGR
ncbi:ribosome small subunit-dependent GTPase A [Pseudodesulfovibrio alkaliphilus]|nr:ribosome small subunit-dependent GTPase A [Pseudodesulfovibrio alkaliphilus]